MSKALNKCVKESPELMARIAGIVDYALKNNDLTLQPATIRLLMSFSRSRSWEVNKEFLEWWLEHYQKAKTKEMIYDPNTVPEKDVSRTLETQLLVAMSKGPTKSLEETQRLIDKGVNVNASNEEGTTALMLAIREYNFDTARLLVEHGADMSQRNIGGICARDLLKRKEKYLKAIKERVEKEKKQLEAAYELYELVHSTFS